MENHPMPYRILWTWDSWICDPYSAESYINEYKKLIDFMVEWDYNGLIIWGFIDARHGGEESAKEVASYGKQKGIRVMPGVGAGGYEGFVTSGNHKYSITTLTKERPELQAYTRANPSEPNSWWACLYQEGTREWLREGAKWLAENFDIGGVNIETNENMCIDVCEHAAEATKNEPNRLRYSASFSDLSIAVPIIYDEVKKQHPEAWVTYATYQPSWWKRQEDAWLLKDMPQDSIAQWNIEMDNNEELVPSPVKNNISLIHSGGWSYHLDAYPPIWGFTQYRCFYPNLEQARLFALHQRNSGLDGFVLGNVGSHLMPDNEIAYIAYIEFARKPDMTMDEFSERFIGKLYGNEAEPLVKELMLTQTGLHERVRGVWWCWVKFMRGDMAVGLASAQESDIADLEKQIEIANQAIKIASEEGRGRLQIILQVLSEYLSIARMSVDPRLAELITGKSNMDDVRLREEKHKVAAIAADLGLPDGIYRYSELGN